MLVAHELKLIFDFILGIIREFWWFIVLIISAKIFFDLRKLYLQKQKKAEEIPKDWIFLEIKVSHEVYQTPKFIEQAFAGIHALTKGYLILEIAGNNKKKGFYIRAPKEYRQFIESQIYARYPVDIEIEETEDYLETIFPDIFSRYYNLWGAELIFTKDNCFPLRTYSYFEELKEEKRIEPIASLLEGMNKLEEGEWCIIQIILKPADEKWLKDAEEVIAKLIGKKIEKKITFKDWLDAFILNFIKAPVAVPEWPSAKKDEEKRLSDIQFLSPGMREIIKEAENKISKLGFESGIRLLYLAPKEIYSEMRKASLIAFFKQFNTENLNSLKINDKVSTEVKGLFKTKREFLRKLNFYEKFRQRAKTEKSIILNTEELATIYHFPFTQLKIPSLERLPIRKGEPPPNLPIG